MDEAVYKKLKELCPNVKRQVPMSEHTTFRTGGECDCMVVADTPEELEAVTAYLDGLGISWFLLGNGSNILVSDAGYRGVMLMLGEDFGRVDTDGEEIVAGGAVMLSRLASTAVNAGLAGLEFASGIPGTVGGAIMMNAGAYGGEMCDVTKSARIFFPGEGVVTLSGEEMDFGYRHSILKEKKGVLLEVSLSLHFGNKEDIISRVSELGRSRREKQPLEYPSAGSTFKRPAGAYAGKLIMEAGLAGLRCGGAEVSKKHCGFVINTGGATSSDVYEVIRTVQEKVKENSGFELEPEVILLGEFNG